MKILIVDDKEEALYLLDAMLKASGYEIVSARNGVEALKVLRENTVDMIISDILMPKMDGFQLCRECKGDDTLREIPFVFYTATYTDKKDEEFALSLGAEKFMVKPVEPREFMDMIQLVLEEHRQGTLVAPKKPIEEEAVYLAQYNERLIKKLEKKMQELEMAHKNLNQIFETLGSGIRVIDKDFNTLRVNRAFSSLSGVEEDEAVGKKCHQVFPGPQCHTPDCTLTRILSGE
jgi:putative two-component system response regulator